MENTVRKLVALTICLSSLLAAAAQDKEIDLIRKPGAYVRARLGNPCITVTAQTHEGVVLGRDLASRPREVQSERRHVTAQVFHAEDQVFRQVVRVSPNGPAAA